MLKWGKYILPPKYATDHFLVAGATGSGKTVLIRILMQSALGNRKPCRAMIYDPKQEELPYIFNIVGDYERVRVLHPFDLRGCAWDIALDIDGPLSAQQLASILVPQANNNLNSDSFFDDSVRDLLTGVILAFINCVPNAKSWTFRDIILTMLYAPYLEFILKRDTTREGKPFPFTSRLQSSYLQGDSRTIGNIRASINTKLGKFEPIAAVWHWAQKSGQTFSLNQWLTEGCYDVLVLGNDESSRFALDSINQAIFKRAAELMLARRELSSEEKETGTNLSWVFLDEVREAGRLDGLSRLLTKGRSKGVAVVLGFQDIDGMRAAYETEVANEICGQCSNIAVLKLSSPTTAEWAVDLFGRRLTQVESTGRQMNYIDSSQSASTTTSEEERSYLYSADFIYLPKTSIQTGLNGYFRGSYSRPNQGFRVSIPWMAPDNQNEGIEDLLPKAHPRTYRSASGLYSNFWPRPVEHYYLSPWDEEDWARLGFPGYPPPWNSTVTKPEPRPASGPRSIN